MTLSLAACFLRENETQFSENKISLTELNGRTKRSIESHGYSSHVRVGRGSEEIYKLSCWAGVVTPKPPVSAKKAKCYGRTEGPTDG